MGLKVVDVKVTLEMSAFCKTFFFFFCKTFFFFFVREFYISPGPRQAMSFSAVTLILFILNPYACVLALQN